MASATIIKTAMVVHAKTGVILKEFTGADLLRGKQYWHAWCCGNYWRIVDEHEDDNIITITTPEGEEDLDIDGKAFYILVG